MPHPDGAAAGPERLETLVPRQLASLAPRNDPAVVQLLAEIHRRLGERVAGVLLYGSYLRGKRDTLLDFYVLLTGLGALPRLQAWGNRALPPNVYYLSLPAPAGATLRAKYATMTLAQFERAMGTFESYFWSRFTQPAALVDARDDEAARRIAAAMAAAMRRFSSEVAPMMDGVAAHGYAAAEFWRRGLALTYGCELRSENPAGVADLYRHHARHFDALLAAYAGDAGAAVARNADGSYGSAGARATANARLRWRVRRVLGKLLSVLRLVKAAGTFEDPLDYLLWKIERHSGIYIAPTERQRRYPLVFGWGLLWRLYRRGAFR